VATTPQTQTASGAAQRSAAAARPAGRFHIVHPAELARAFEVEGPLLVLGRLGDGELAVRHQTVSRRHLELAWDAGTARYHARDLESHNGSAIDGVALGDSARALGDGAVLRVGDVILVFEHGPAVEDAPEVSRDAVPGQAAATRVLRAQIARAAADPSPVLLVGETGTGKERIAAELHRLSGRRGPLVPVNCAAFSANLVESQLLGHVRGAFTGAQGESAGLIRSAGGGTLFLDEIGELPLDLQPKLLRVIQEREVLPVGGARALKVDVRMVGASNRDLARLVDEGGFRRDLYARMAMWELRVPPLRERRADILAWLRLLSERWLTERALTANVMTFSAQAAEALVVAEWHDNLRGLDRFVHEHAERDQMISLSDLPSWIVRRAPAPPVPPPPPAAPKRPAPTRDELEAVLARLGGNIRATTKHYGRDHRQIYRWMEAFGLKGEGQGDA
jgi:transcriptional regulator with GAF, ATPase, and Fis domain